MAYDRSDIRSQLSTAGATTGANVAPQYFEYDKRSPTEKSTAGSELWWARSQACVFNYARSRAGDPLSRSGQRDEYMVLLHDRDATAYIAAAGETVTATGRCLVIVPPGDSSVTMDRDAEVVRLFTSQSPDLCAQCDNADFYREPDPNVAEFAPWPDPPAGHRIRVYPLDDVAEDAKRFGRLYRCSTLMVNYFYEVGPRDPAKMSPHHHDDFEQLSLQLGGDYIHHIRTPWTPDMGLWRDDEHAFCTSPSVTVIPPPSVHTSQAVGDDAPPAGRRLLPAPVRLLGEGRVGAQRRRVPRSRTVSPLADRVERVPSGLRRPGRPTFGTWVKLPTIETLELLADAGFEFVVIDLEHSPLTLESAYTLFFAAQHLGMTALVRVADRSGNYLQRVLDAGVDGVLVPQVSSVEEAAAAVAGMTFSPVGRRGAGSTSRAGRWGLDSVAQYRADGDSIVKGIQLEDREALEDLEPILDVAGLGAVFLGMGDLTLSTGLPATDPALVALTDNLLAETAKRNLPCGTAVGDATAAAAAAARGFSFVMVSNDTTIFARAANELGRAVRESFAPLR